MSSLVPSNLSMALPEVASVALFRVGRAEGCIPRALQRLVWTLAILALTCPSGFAQGTEVPAWFYEMQVPPLPTAYETLGWPKRALGRTRAVQLKSGTWISGSLTSGQLASVGGGYFGSIPTTYTAICDVKVVNLLDVDPSFGNESILIAGIRPDGCPQVSVMLRFDHEDPRTQVIHQLPTIGQPGEIYCRVGAWSGAILIFEAADRKIISYVDGDADKNPEVRLPALFTFAPGSRVPQIHGLHPFKTSALPRVIDFGGRLNRSTGKRTGLFLDGTTIVCGDLALMPPPPPRAAQRFLVMPRAGMRSLSLAGVPGDSLFVEYRAAAADPAATFTPWVGPIQATTYDGVITPLAPTALAVGDQVRIVVAGQVAEEWTVTSPATPIPYGPWPDADILAGLPFILQGTNFELATHLEWRWHPRALLDPLPATVIQSVPVQALASGTELHVPGLQLPALPGSLTLWIGTGPGSVAPNSRTLLKP